MEATFKNMCNIFKARFEGKVKLGFYWNGDSIKDFDNVSFMFNVIKIVVYDNSQQTIEDTRMIVNAFMVDCWAHVNVIDKFGLVEVIVSDSKFKERVDDEELEFLKKTLPYDKAQLIK